MRSVMRGFKTAVLVGTAFTTMAVMAPVATAEEEASFDKVGVEVDYGPINIDELDTAHIPDTDLVKTFQGNSNRSFTPMAETGDVPGRYNYPSWWTPAGDPRLEADPDTGARIEAIELIDSANWGPDYTGVDLYGAQLYIYSPANERVMRVGISTPRGTDPRPSLYMLDGYADFVPEPAAGETPGLWAGSGWVGAGHAFEFFSGKDVNAVFTVDGGPSMYRDWKEEHPTRGKMQIETFLVEELQPLIDRHYFGNGTNGIAGISSGAAAAVMTAVRNPSEFETVVGMSGIYDVANLTGHTIWNEMFDRKGIESDWVFGGYWDRRWRDNDPYIHARELRGKTVYLSASAGMPGQSDWDNVNPGTGSLKLGADPIVIGAPLEATAYRATQRFSRHLRWNGVRAETDFRLTGVHDWPLWERQLPIAWPTISRGLGI